MSQKITIELPDDLFQSAKEKAAWNGLGLEEWLVRQIGYAAPTPEMRLESFDGLLKKIDSVPPAPGDNSHNEQLERDLAAEYADTHDEPR